MTKPEDERSQQTKRMTNEELDVAIRQLQRLANKLIAERKAREEEARPDFQKAAPANHTGVDFSETP